MRALDAGSTGQGGAELPELLLTRGYEMHGVMRRACLFGSQDIKHRPLGRSTKAGRRLGRRTEVPFGELLKMVRADANVAAAADVQAQEDAC